MNDISAASKLSNIRLFFSDDSNIFIVYHYIAELFKMADVVMNELNGYSYPVIGLVLIWKKTTYMIFKLNAVENDAIINHNLLLFVNNVVIRRTSVFKYCGIFIDELLNWKPHISRLIKKIPISLEKSY